MVMDDAEQVKARAVGLAAEALRAAVAGDGARALAAVRAVSDETGGEGVSWMLTGWCDTLIHVQNQAEGWGPESWAAPRWLNTDTGHVDEDAAAVPASVRWAGQLVAARGRGDQDMYQALLESMPGDGAERGRYACALLYGCAETVQLYGWPQ